MITFPYEVSHSAASAGRWRMLSAIPEPSRTSTEANATVENRGTTTTRPATRRAAGRLAQSTSSPTSPPIQTEPEATWSQSASERQHARRGLRRVAGDAGDRDHGGGGRERGDERRGARRPIAAGARGRSSQTAIQPATQKSAKQIHMST